MARKPRTSKVINLSTNVPLCPHCLAPRLVADFVPHPTFLKPPWSCSIAHAARQRGVMLRMPSAKKNKKKDLTREERRAPRAGWRHCAATSERHRCRRRRTSALIFRAETWASYADDAASPPETQISVALQSRTGFGLLGFGSISSGDGKEFLRDRFSPPADGQRNIAPI